MVCKSELRVDCEVTEVIARRSAPHPVEATLSALKACEAERRALEAGADIQSPCEARCGEADPEEEPVRPADLVVNIDKELKKLRKKHRRELEACVQERVTALEPELFLGGTVFLELLYQGGQVLRVREVADSTNDPEFVRCLKSRVTSWVLPAAVSETVRLPLEFGSAGG